jgi:aspartyl-tRNA(Asn)/glutamyl-tRNA(Gln) amidotransferase subunit C
MISKEEVQHIAKLARIELTEKEIEKMQKDLSEILDYFNLLKKAPKPEKTEKQVVKNDHLRKDEARHSQLADEIIEAAPDKKDDYIKVKAIF